uniref:GLOBIN domain-containing protein n=1 Tax=Panagrellus redivivus TaxID=6233 RepID=A0A7E5A1Y8_PANRE
MGNAKSTENGTGSSSKENVSLKGGSSSGNMSKNGSTSTLNKPKINAPSDKSMKRSSKGAGSARSSMSSEGQRKPVLPLNQRQIIKSCMDNSKDDLGERIYRRVIDRRDDFRFFVESLPKQQRAEMSEGLRVYLQKVSESLTDADEVQRLSEDFGERHVPFRSLGFRPDFFAMAADAMTTECVFLDCAVHQPTETLTAWSTLTSTMFSAVRDGFYAELRRMRRLSNNCMNPKNKSIDFSLDGSSAGEDTGSRRSLSPTAESNESESKTAKSGSTSSTRVTATNNNNANANSSSASLQPSESSNFLSPPQVY